LDKLNSIYTKTNGKIWPLWKLYKQLIEKRGMSIEQVVNAVDIAIHKLPHMENLYRQAKDQAEKMQRTIQRLVNHIMALEHKISILDKIAFSSEQERKRTEQRVQELTAQKDIIGKDIANILNGEGYSKLNQIAKESVKAVLAENRKLISISLVALIQTIKTDPEMAKLIYNIPTMNDGERHKDNNNNSITKYLELKKDKILDLAEKNYENLLEALTDNTLGTAAPSSSTSTLQLPSHSSLIFLSHFDQSDKYRIEEPEMCHNSIGNIAD